MRKFYRTTLFFLVLLNSAAFFLGIYYYGENETVSYVSAMQEVNVVEENTLDSTLTNEEQMRKDSTEIEKIIESIGKDTETTEEENSKNNEDKSSELNEDETSEANESKNSKLNVNENLKGIIDKTSTVSAGKVKNEKKKELTILAVGDNLIHTQVIRSGKQADGSYNFSHLFAGITEELESADLAIINQETILCDESLGYSGYPKFGSPYEIGEAIHEAGFDVVLQATNHTMDKGYDGVLDTIEFWKKYDDILMVGVNETDDPLERIGLYTKNGITVAILNYTYGLNGLSMPKGKEYLVNLLTDRKQMKADIALAKKLSDFVIVCPHWGSEYVYKPTKQQDQLTQFFLEEGVDLVLGTHPHVLEPVEWVETKDGSHRMLVYYSLGNFVSNQDAMARMLGGMAKIKLIKKGDEVVIDEASIEPLVTHTYYDGGQRFTTYLLSDYNEKMASTHYLNRKKKSTVTLENLTELTQSILGDWYRSDTSNTMLSLTMQSQ